MNAVLDLAPDGTITMVKNEDLPLNELGKTDTRRASNVWPCNPRKRFAFRLLRFFFGERGAIATWCRRWYGPWEVRWTDNPHVVAFTHPSRRVCIDWEVKQLNRALLQN